MGKTTKDRVYGAQRPWQPLSERSSYQIQTSVSLIVTIDVERHFLLTRMCLVLLRDGQRAPVTARGQAQLKRLLPLANSLKTRSLASTLPIS